MFFEESWGKLLKKERGKLYKKITEPNLLRSNKEYVHHTTAICTSAAETRRKLDVNLDPELPRLYLKDLLWTKN